MLHVACESERENVVQVRSCDYIIILYYINSTIIIMYNNKYFMFITISYKIVCRKI